MPPPAGWRTLRDRKAGFTIAAPSEWPERRRARSLLLRSPDNAVAVTIVADRGQEGRRSTAGRYARRVIAKLPRFEGRIEPGEQPVARSPYEAAVVRARETIEGGERPQRISVAVLRRPELVSYAAVVLEDLRSRDPRNERVVRRMLATLRAQPPARE